MKNFEFDLQDNISQLHYDLIGKTYRHAPYHSFYIQDPKLRHIQKATVRDRVLYHALFRILYPLFDKTFIFDSYSCRVGKGTHKAVNRLQDFSRKVSKNNTKACFILKCDVKKFFDSIDHAILSQLLRKQIVDRDTIWLVEKVIGSYSVSRGRGIPMGNITSQLFANIYLNEFDQFAKHKLKAQHYIRYCDDFLIFSDSRQFLEQSIPAISGFLNEKLQLALHPQKIIIKTLASGIDFLGWVNFYHHRVLRNSTKKRMLKRLTENKNAQTVNAYLGMISHGNTHKIRQEVDKLSSDLLQQNRQRCLVTVPGTGIAKVC